MQRYILSRVFQGLIALLALSLIIFMSVHLSGIRPCCCCRRKRPPPITSSFGRTSAWTDRS